MGAHAPRPWARRNQGNEIGGSGDPQQTGCNPDPAPVLLDAAVELLVLSACTRCTGAVARGLARREPLDDQVHLVDAPGGVTGLLLQLVVGLERALARLGDALVLTSARKCENNLLDVLEQ